MPGFEVLRGSVFDFYKLSVECFGSPEDFGISDVEALCSVDYHKGYFQNSINRKKGGWEIYMYILSLIIMKIMLVQI